MAEKEGRTEELASTLKYFNPEITTLTCPGQSNGGEEAKDESSFPNQNFRHISEPSKEQQS